MERDAKWTGNGALEEDGRRKTEDGRVTDIVLSAPAEESDRERGRDRE
jgi:hypothetical protein